MPKAFPVTHDANFIDDAYAHPDVWNGTAIAIQARVRLVRPASGGRALLELEVDSPVTAIWAVWVTQWMDDFVAPGDVVRVTGWLNKTSDWNQATQSAVPAENPLTLLAICMVRVPSKEQLFDKKYLGYCDAWREGQLPPDMLVRK